VTNGNSNSNSSNGSGTTSHTNSSSCCSVENQTAAHFVLHVSSSAYSSHASTQQHHHTTTSKAGSRSRSSSVSAVKIAPKEPITTAASSSISSSCSVSSSTSSSTSTAVSAKTRRHSLKHMIAETQVRSGMMNSSSTNSRHTMPSSSSGCYNSKDIELDLQCTTPYERSRWQLALLLAVHGSNGSGTDGSLTVHDVNRVLRGTTQTTVKEQLQGLADTVNTTTSSRHISSKAFGLTALAVVKFNSKRRNRQRLFELLKASDDERVQQQQQQ
jgi:trimeric autotransporter adhesin